jgi:hypothetical protein
MSVATYSAADMVILVNGIQISGFSDSDTVTVALDETKFTKYTGVDGVTSRSHNASDAGKFTFSLAQTSDANAVFAGFLKLDLADLGSNAVFGVAVLDPNNPSTFYLGTGAWVEGMPESGFAKEIGTREWVVEASDIKWGM